MPFLHILLCSSLDTPPEPSPLFDVRVHASCRRTSPVVLTRPSLSAWSRVRFRHPLSFHAFTPSRARAQAIAGVPVGHPRRRASIRRVQSPAASPRTSSAPPRARLHCSPAGIEADAASAIAAPRRSSTSPSSSPLRPSSAPIEPLVSFSASLSCFPASFPSLPALPSPGHSCAAAAAMPPPWAHAAGRPCARPRAVAARPEVAEPPCASRRPVPRPPCFLAAGTPVRRRAVVTASAPPHARAPAPRLPWPRSGWAVPPAGHRRQGPAPRRREPAWPRAGHGHGGPSRQSRGGGGMTGSWAPTYMWGPDISPPGYFVLFPEIFISTDIS